MATQPEPLRLTLEQYLEREDRQGTRHEFVDGLVFALAGASDTHQTILANLTTLVRPALRGSACRIFTNEIKVIPPNRRRARYPDLLVTCDESDRADRYVKRYPKLIIEVLSPSTAATDRTEKLDEYQTIPTLDEYVLVDSLGVGVLVFRRSLGDSWMQHKYAGDEHLRLSSISLDVSLRDVYEDVDFSALALENER